jgi:hypothetical protein
MESTTKLEEAEKFPAPVYSETVLAVNFEDAKKYFLQPLLEIHYAHTLMLSRQGPPRRRPRVFERWAHLTRRPSERSLTMAAVRISSFT